MNQRFQRGPTDEGRREERGQTDEAWAANRRHTEEVADDVDERAQARADEVLDTARPKADDPLHQGSSAAAQDAVAQERSDEDEVLEQEVTERSLSDMAVANRDEFLGMVSHDLRNLLGCIASNARLVSLQSPDTDEGKCTAACMARIERTIARMNRLIGDLLDVTSIEAGHLAMQPRPDDAAELLAEAIASFALAAGEKRLSLEYAFAGTALPAVFDRERLLQVLANLIANAMKFTPSGGEITLSAALAGGDLHISVIDTGEGIPQAMREVVFERYRQVDGKDRGGLGLGLYISKSIVEAHGGRIWIESNPACTGSALHLTIPAGSC